MSDVKGEMSKEVFGLTELVAITNQLPFKKRIRAIIFNEKYYNNFAKEIEAKNTLAEKYTGDWIVSQMCGIDVMKNNLYPDYLIAFEYADELVLYDIRTEKAHRITKNLFETVTRTRFDDKLKIFTAEAKK